jgi:hypothetical protein
LAGRTFEEAETVIQHYARGAGVSHVPVEFVGEVPMNFEELEELAASLVHNTDAGDVVFIDASFPRKAARSYQIVDDFVSGLLSQAPILDATCQLVVSMHALPNRVDSIADLPALHQLAGRLAIVDEADRHLGDTDLARVIGSRIAAVPIQADSTDSLLLRRRGVFRSTSEGRPTLHNMFYYEASEDAIVSFTGRLEAALRDAKPDVVIFDASTSGPWFSSVVAAACVKVQTASRQELTSVEVAQWQEHLKGTLKDPERARVMQATELLRDERTTIAVVVPGFLTGRSLTRVLELVGSPDLSRCTAIAIFADDDKALRTPVLPMTRGIAICPYGKREIEVHCMHQVELRTIDRDSWLVEVADILHEIRDLPVVDVERQRLDRVALWSLFEEQGVSVERLPAGARAPKKHFPDLRELDDWDAHWIAQCAIDNILGRLPVNQEALLVVIPAEENGTLPISDALLRRCGVAVLQVPRRVIDGDDDVPDHVRAKLNRHRADTIVVFDESTVTYGTLGRLVRLVETENRLPPDLVASFLDLASNSPDFNLPYFSLANWAAVAEEQPA